METSARHAGLKKTEKTRVHAAGAKKQGGGFKKTWWGVKQTGWGVKKTGWGVKKTGWGVKKQGALKCNVLLSYVHGCVTYCYVMYWCVYVLRCVMYGVVRCIVMLCSWLCDVLLCDIWLCDVLLCDVLLLQRTSCVTRKFCLPILK